MSKIGKKPVPIPSGVTAVIEGRVVKVKGPKGELKHVLRDAQSVKIDGGMIVVTTTGETKQHKAEWGMTRAILANLIAGVAKGYEKRLEITGVGYKAAVAGKNLQLGLGYSHDISYPIPQGIQVVCPKPTEIVITGIDKQKVGQVAAEIRGFRPPEPYKGKGVKYAGEFIFRKEGKKK